jgi:hypothetical protein
MPTTRYLPSDTMRIFESKHCVMTAAMLLTLSSAACSGSHQSYRAMEEQLLSREANFAELVKAFSEDSHVNSIGFDYAFMEGDTKEALSEARLSEYRDMLKRLGLSRIGRGGGIHLSVSTKDLLVARSQKDFYYAKFEPSPLVDSIDSISRAGGDRRDQAPVFKKIKGKLVFVI